jgi:hypothetical protein
MFGGLGKQRKKHANECAASYNPMTRLLED